MRTFECTSAEFSPPLTVEKCRLAWFDDVCRRPRDLPSLSLVRLLVILPFAFDAAILSAAEYSGTPRAQVEFEYNDNRQLRVDPGDPAFGVIVELGGDMAMSTDTSALRVSPSFRIQRFDSEEPLDSNDFYLDALAEHRTPKVELRFLVNFAYDSTLTSELATIGRVPDRRRRTAFDLEPALRYALSERTDIGVRYNHSSVSYEDGISAGLFDFTNDVGELTANYQLSETEELWTSFFGGRFDTEQINRSTDSLALTVGYSKTFSETLDVSLSVGGVTSTSKGSPFGLSLTSDSTGWVYDLAVSKRFERTQIRFGSAQTRTPTSEARIVERTDVRIEVIYDFDPFWSTNFRALAYRNRSLGEALTRSDVNVMNLGIGIIRRLTRRWSISGSYQYWRSDDEITSSTAESNAIFLTLIYTGDRFSMSR